jgi:DtxR family transcriptional regulator, Mn-dependent transcriptional regulator
LGVLFYYFCFMKLTYTEENYLKAIYFLSEGKAAEVSTNAIAERLQTKASSVTDMIRKLAEKKLVMYEKYQGVTLTREGKKIAIGTIRKHRLWEVFLVEKLQFGWDEVHEVAEQLEHIQSAKLIDSLDDFLGFPDVDPHGDPIPDRNGKFAKREESFELAVADQGDKLIITGVNDTSSSFLVFLQQQGLILGASMKVIEIFPFDRSVVVELKDKKRLTLSNMVTRNILVRKK